MKHMQKKLLFHILAISGLQVFAQDKVPGIIVELESGKKVEYALSSSPRLTFDGNIITLTAEGVKVEYVPSEIAKVKMGSVSPSSGVEEQKSTQETIKLDDGFIRLTGFSKYLEVRIYNIGGSHTATYRTSADGLLLIPMSSLPTGISIIKAGQQTIKITKQ
jgi:hypothetical protein